MGSFKELINILPLPFNFVVILMVIIFGAGLITSLMKQIRKFACHRDELEFKREMIDRGMSVEEVERLVLAKGANQLEDSV